jgi:hypothetical protein
VAHVSPLHSRQMVLSFQVTVIPSSFNVCSDHHHQLADPGLLRPDVLCVTIACPSMLAIRITVSSQRLAPGTCLCWDAAVRSRKANENHFWTCDRAECCFRLLFTKNYRQPLGCARLHSNDAANFQQPTGSSSAAKRSSTVMQVTPSYYPLLDTAPLLHLGVP